MTYEELNREWQELYSGLGYEMQKKIKSLLVVHDDLQIRSNIEILLSLGECSLCSILEHKGRLIRISRVLQNGLIWKQAIVEQVRNTHSVWFNLYAEGYFDSMEFMIFESQEYHEASRERQDKLFHKMKRMIAIVPQRFMMGGDSEDSQIYEQELPSHEVVLQNPFEIGMYPVTQGVYEKVMGVNPSGFKGLSRPVECVSWCDAVLFCNRLSEMEELEPCYETESPFKNHSSWSKDIRWNRYASGYRLLTEAEWEYCARGAEGYIFSGGDRVGPVAWYDENSSGMTHAIGQKQPNGLGLFDMSGNVRELVFDTFRSYDSYRDPFIMNDHENTRAPRVARGGCWKEQSCFHRVSDRSLSGAANRHVTIGFRVGRSV